MAITLEDAQSFVGDDGDSYDALLSECLAEAVALLSGYVRHLRVTLEDGTTRGVTVTVETDATTGAKTYTWQDVRDPDAHELVPVELLDRATKEVTADLFTRRNSENGIVNRQFSTPEGVGSSPVRINRDPLVPAYALLARWTVPF